MGVLDVEDGVVGRLPGDLGDVERQRGVAGVAGERVAERVDPDQVDELLERDQVAGALGELDLLAVLHDLDHLADQDLEGLRRVVAGAGGHRAQPADVPVVVGAEEVEQPVEAALPLVDVVGRVAGEVGQLAVGADQDPVLVVAEVGGPHPQRTVRVEQVALAAQLLQARRDVLAVVEGPLGEPDVDVGAERVELLPLLLELQPIAGIAEGDDPARRPAGPGSPGCRPRPSAPARGCSRRGSRRRAPPGPVATASSEAPKRFIWLPRSLM